MLAKLEARQESACSDSLVCPDGSGSFQCCGEGFTCCIADDGTGACCPFEVDASSGCLGEDCTEVDLAAEAGTVPTVVLTTTVVRTVTVGSSTRTTVVPITVFQTITFQDPALRTQTITVSITSGVAARRQIRRQETTVPQTAAQSDTVAVAATQPTVTGTSPGTVATGRAVSASTSELAANAGARTVTITTTVEVVTTVTGIVTVTSGVFNTVFVTVTVAPSATTTVFTTTTVRPRPEITGGQLPGGFIPPTGNEGLLPPNPPILPSGSPGSSLLPPGAGQNPTVTSGTQLPPGVTSVLPPGDPQSMMPTSMNPSASPTGPVRPIPGSNLTSDEIAGIALGIIFGLFFLILAGFLIYRLVKKKEALDITRHHQEMVSSGSGSIPVGAASILSNGTQNRLIRPAPVAVAAGALGSDGTSSTGPGDGDVRIVIRPAPKRRTQSSGLFPPSGQGSRAASGSSSAGAVAEGSRRAQFPRPPGYSGQTYSFFVEESGSTSPQDPTAWSLASDHGSRNDPGTPTDKWSPTFPRIYDPINRDVGGSGGGGGSDFLSVGRALSPWKPI
ncbi:hypothetical protein jhhlp_002743 [Lomentospora prolificans]|uniref:Uncharacterized protein n=1 Tax=Lomentospora prolificans TaxID=41688 RepID=A0A2N3NEX3_9PEZI|nr:hypothetical protein jhhlp_002743 [Lomentospora prolificans]